MVLNFDNWSVYYTKAILPLTGKAIFFEYIRSKDQWYSLIDKYRSYFSAIQLYEYNPRNDFKDMTKLISKCTNHTFKKRILIPRIKRTKKKPLKGNLCVKKEGDVAYIQVSYLKKRKILKIDIEDLPILEDVCKNSFYFIYRPLKLVPNNIVLSKKKSRKFSLYSYILKKHVKTIVTHIDSDDTNFCKNNLQETRRALNYRKEKKVTSESFKPKKLNDLVGICKCYELHHPNYYTRLVVNNNRILIGRSNDPYEIAKMFDIARLYYLGASYSINYPLEYYLILEQNLFKKMILSFKKRKNQAECKLAQDLIDDIVGESQKD